MQGWFVLGWFVRGWFVLGWFVLGWFVLGWFVLRWFVQGWFVLGRLLPPGNIQASRELPMRFQCVSIEILLWAGLC